MNEARGTGFDSVMKDKAEIERLRKQVSDLSRLAREFEEAPVVYADFKKAKDLKGPWFVIGPQLSDTHMARLVGIEEIKK